MTVLSTERLTLTPVAVGDMDDLTALWADAEFTRHIMGRGLSEEEVWFRLLRDIGHWQAKGYGNWSIRKTTPGAYVGSVGVLDYRREIDPPFDAPELGWGVAPAFQGAGLAREALEISVAGLRRRAERNADGQDESHFLDVLQEIVDSGKSAADRKLELFHGPWQGNIDRVFSEFAY